MHSHLSQVAAKKKIILEDARVRVSALFHESGSVLAGTQRGFADGFQVEIDLESKERKKEIAALLALSHQMCFTEIALARPVNIKVKHILNGEDITPADRIA